MVNHLFDPISSEYTSSIKNVTDRVQPRVAFSWSPYTGTVVRGGYGLFSALNQGSTYYAMRVENGVVQLNYTYAGCYPISSCPTPPAAGSKLQYPNVPFLPPGPALSTAQYPTGGAAPTVNPPATATISYGFHGLDPNFVPPFAHEMNLSVEQALPGKLSLQVGYVGTRGMRLPVFIDANLVGVKPSGLASYAVQDKNNNITSTITVPVYLPTDRRNQALSSFNTGYSVANTWYNALAVTARRPFSNGLELLGNYTWAKATDTGQVGGANGTFYGGDTPSDPNNIRFDNGPSDTDIRNRATISFVYKPEIMKDNKLMKYILDDFQFSGAEIASGGEPIFLGVSGTIYRGQHQLIQLCGSERHLRRRNQFWLGRRHQRTSSANRAQQHLHAGIQRLRHAGVARHSNPRQDLHADQRGGLQPAEPHHHYGRQQHLHHIPCTRCDSERQHIQVPGHHTSGRIPRHRMLCSLSGHRARGLRSGVEYQQQLALRLAEYAVLRQAFLLKPGSIQPARQLRLPRFCFYLRIECGCCLIGDTVECRSATTSGEVWA